VVLLSEGCFMPNVSIEVSSLMGSCGIELLLIILILELLECAF